MAKWKKEWSNVEDDKSTTYEQFNPPEFYDHIKTWVDDSGKKHRKYMKKGIRRTGERRKKSIAIWLRGEGQNYIWGDFFQKLYKKGWSISWKWMPKNTLKIQMSEKKEQKPLNSNNYRRVLCKCLGLLTRVRGSWLHWRNQKKKNQKK